MRWYQRAVLMAAALLPGCGLLEPDPITGCTDAAALNRTFGAEKDDGTCEYSRVVFYVRPAAGPYLPVTVRVDGATVGQINGVWFSPPGNCSAEFTAPMRLRDGRPHDWNAATNGSQFVNAGVVQADHGKECIVVPVF